MKRFFTGLLILVFLSSSFSTTIKPKNVVLKLSESFTAHIKSYETSLETVIVDTMQYSSKNPDVRFCRIYVKVKNISTNSLNKDDQYNQISQLKLICYQSASDTFSVHDLEYGTIYWRLNNSLLPDQFYNLLSFYVYEKSETPVAFVTDKQSNYLLIDDQNEIYSKTLNYLNDTASNTITN